MATTPTNAPTPKSKGPARVYDRPSAVRRLAPRVLLSLGLFVVSCLTSWWMWRNVFN